MEGKARDTFDAATMFDLSGKVALVTGCTRGIGLGIAQALASAGADIIGVDVLDDAKALRQSVEAAGRKCTAMQADFSDRASVEGLLQTLAKDAAPIDILVNNAGMIARAPALEHSTETWDRVLEVNLTTPFVLTRELGKGMVERGYGKVIFTASLLSFQGGILVPSYTASKSGIAGLVRAFANEWAPLGVNVNGIAPGYIATDNTAALRADADRSRTILERIPAGRWGAATDIAGAAVFLASPASDYVCGSIIPVDGGWMGR